MNKLSVYELCENPFSLIGKKWAMVTARAGGAVNTMTASWGGLGVMWNLPAAFLFLRPQRYTRELIDSSERFSLCFLPEQYREQLAWCGAHSGREGDKLAQCGFTSCELDGAPALGQSDLVLTCRKLYRQQMEPACFKDRPLLAQHYPQQDYHILYVAEILSAYQK